MRAFHETPDAGRAVGSFRVDRPAGRLRRGLGNLLGFPPAAESVTVVLEVEIHGKRERWIRAFGDHRLITEQEASGRFLLERFGAVRSFYALSVVQGALVYELVAMRLLGVPLPRFLRPHDRTVEQGTEQGWEVNVRIALPILGELIRYGGRLRWRAT